MTGFLIVSPWRSGSTVTAFALNEYCKTKNSNLDQPIIFLDSDPDLYWTKDHVHHTHEKKYIKIMPANFTLIINQRDPFDSIVSRMVAEKLDIWHKWNYESVNTKNVDFTIDIDLFTEYYKVLLEYNHHVSKILNTVPHYKINYDDIKNNNLNNIFKICNIDYEILSHHRSIPTKTNLDYPNLIPNYAELFNTSIVILNRISMW